MRAARLDDALAVLTGLWSGAPFTYHGTHYQVQEAHFTPPPLQTPRIPIWVAGFWPRRAPFRPRDYRLVQTARLSVLNEASA